MKIINKASHLPILLQLIDRGFAFSFPLVVFWLFGGPQSFITVELIFAWSGILVVIFDLGASSSVIRNGRPDSGVDRKTLAEISVKILFLGGGAALLIGTFAHWYINPDIRFWHIFSRTFYLAFLGVYLRFLVLENNHAKGFTSSITTWLLIFSASVFLGAFTDEIALNVLVITIPSVLVGLYIFRELIGATGGLPLVLQSNVGWSLLWARPIVLSSLLMMANLNATRIILIESFDEDLIEPILFWMRICMIIQVAHSVLYFVLSKDIVIGKFDASFKNKSFLFYGLGVFGAVGVVGLLFLLHLRFGIAPDVDWIVLAVILMSTLAWCALGFNEAFFQKMDKTPLILIVHLSWITMLMFLLVWLGYEDPVELIYLLCASGIFAMFFSFFLLTLNLRKA